MVQTGNMRIKTGIFIALLGVVTFGAGCNQAKSVISNITNSVQPAGPRLAVFDGLSPADASKKINFVPGSQIEMRQTYLGLGAKLADKLSGDSKDGVRIITLERFAPENVANLKWKLSRKVETDASIKARQAYESSGSKGTAPEPVTEMQTVTGGLINVDLTVTHKLFPPAYWPTDNIPSRSTSAIWISNEVYEELTKTKTATIYFGITDDFLFGAMNTAQQFSDAINALKASVQKIQNKTDVDLTKADAELAEWPLTVNGKDIKVQVIKARNWYGEIVVLDNPQNPLILKMTFNPVDAGLANLATNNSFLQSLIGYEITRLDNVQ
jgi:hypothetical protein